MHVSHEGPIDIQRGQVVGAMSSRKRFGQSPSWSLVFKGSQTASLLKDQYKAVDWPCPSGNIMIISTVQKAFDDSDAISMIRNHPQDNWTWKPLERARRRQDLPSVRSYRRLLQNMADTQRGRVMFGHLAQELLTETELLKFKQALNQFRISRSVTTLCQQLRPLINTTEKMLLLIELSSRIPKSLQEDFHRLCSMQYNNYETYLRLYSNGNNPVTDSSKVIAQDPSGKFQIVSRGSEKKFMMTNSNFYKNNGDVGSLHGTSVTSGIYSENDDLTSLKQLDTVDGDSDVFVWTPQYGRIDASHSAFVSKDNIKTTGIKRIFIERRDDGSLGLGIIGGKEYGTDITVNVVDPDGPAAEQGLQPGDKILEVNGTVFSHMTHAEAVQLMRNAWNVIMMVQSPSSAKNGRVDNVRIREIELIVYPTIDGRLGISTNRQNKIKYLLVKEVEKHSPAYKAGILVGDYITRIDGVDIRKLTERQITSLTRSKRLTLWAKRFVRDDGSGNFVPVYSNNTVLKGFSPQFSSSPRTKKSPANFDNLDDNILNDFNGLDVNDNPNDESYPEGMINDTIAHVYRNPQPQHIIIRNGSTENVQQHHRRPSIHDSTNNWLLSPQGQAAKKYFQTKSYITAPNLPPPRSHSADAVVSNSHFERRGRHTHRDQSPNVWGSGVRRYVRSRSQSPNPLMRSQGRMSRRDRDVMAAIQLGMEKRQRALRLSLYQPQNSSMELDLEM
ncbi:hypothetical protein FSP39_019029 [Pinctada imbricata]|uniref:PDZ domain-containing protein n=1 Tax=Pinctada imbricata TaxID=66713 RepID=A0AA89CB88_PINIB|nr:hypothetical protein FSP39_019029 [Pinctada imbricata]